MKTAQKARAASRVDKVTNELPCVSCGDFCTGEQCQISTAEGSIRTPFTQKSMVLDVQLAGYTGVQEDVKKVTRLVQEDK